MGSGRSTLYADEGHAPALRGTPFRSARNSLSGTDSALRRSPQLRGVPHEDAPSHGDGQRVRAREGDARQPEGRGRDTPATGIAKGLQPAVHAANNASSPKAHSLKVEPTNVP
jgi:hypothetical protein